MNRLSVVVVARERFSAARRSLDSLLESTLEPFNLIYVDAGSPRRFRNRLRRAAASGRLELIEAGPGVAPNQARNLGLERAQTPYVLFLDNDVLVGPGTLEALARCAEETAAWLVGPLYLQGPPREGLIHMAGGQSRIVDEAGKRDLHENDRLGGCRLSELGASLERSSTELLEFHCLLARREAFDAIGLLDEKLLSVRDQDDLCLQVREAGGGIYIEPSVWVSYLSPPPILPSDRAYYRLRWSRPWIERTLQHFHAKWRLDIPLEDPRYDWLWRRADLWKRQLRQPGRLVRGLAAGRGGPAPAMAGAAHG
ncbi:MAG TPA: glycosyltransferase [Candidatus Polarisedimenticolia bacterium]|nr:glycosyltransferase [Candidatus Polarisedimenticolia bacterium]